MKICVIFSSYEGSESSIQEFDDYQDPSRYTSTHDFTCKFIKKESAKEELDEICSGDYDLVWSFLWGSPHDVVAGLDALKYLESKNVPLIGVSSKFLAMTKVDVKELVSAVGIKTPAYKMGSEKNFEGLKFPVIVKPSEGCGSLHMTQDSVCFNQQQLSRQLALLESKVAVDILIEEFIEGHEMSMMVLETTQGVIGLPPLIYTFPPEMEECQKIFDFENKYVRYGEVRAKIFEENTSLVVKLRETGVKAYEALGVHGSGYGRVDFRVTRQGDIYVLEVSPIPAFFSTPENLFGDDMVIQSTYPGGHEGLVETIISAKHRLDSIISTFDSMASKYDEKFAELGDGLSNVLKALISQYNYDGDVLDVGCGTGYIGLQISAQHPGVKLVGMDASPEMLKWVKGYSSVKIGLVENLMMEEELDSSFDHVISIGMFPFIDQNNFLKILGRIFCLAKSSITFTIEDISPEYNDSVVKAGYPHMVSFNHIQAFENFKVPPEWVLVRKSIEFMWQSPHTGIKMYGLVVRFEKIHVHASNGQVHGSYADSI